VSGFDISDCVDERLSRGTAKRAAQRAAQFVVGVHAALPASELYDRHHQPSQTDKERDCQGCSGQHDRVSQVAECPHFVAQFDDLSFYGVNTQVQPLSQSLEIRLASKITPTAWWEKFHEIIRHGGANLLL